MEDNYLWDRSGEPDPAIQELEEILGGLRYQSQPLEIPSHIRIGRRRSFFPTMAIAAAVTLFAVLLGLWFSFNRRQPRALEANNNSHIDQPVKVTPPQATADKQVATVAVVKNPKQPSSAKRNEATQNLVAGRQRRTTRPVIRQPVLTPQELAEKEQVLVALRLVSAKLNLAQRKAQAVPQLNTIRNQHKIG